MKVLLKQHTSIVDLKHQTISFSFPDSFFFSTFLMSVLEPDFKTLLSKPIDDLSIVSDT